MERKLYADLLRWKASKHRKPLVLFGARQVGKSYLLSQFGKREYKNHVAINLEAQASVRAVFDGDLTPSRIVEQLEAILSVRIEKNKTLLIFDEVQCCDRALTSLKSFAEQAPEYHVVAAGSLLGVAVNRKDYSFPVGKVDELQMFPMNFEEWLWALGKRKLADIIRKHVRTKEKMDVALHEEALMLYRRYLVVGGMPEVVKRYVQTRSLVAITEVQQHILNDYTADMAKYCEPSMAVKVRACYNSIPAQLAKENHKFQYKVVKRGGTATIFGEAIDWLVYAGVVLKCQQAEHPLVPLSAYADLSDFKLYLSDVGLLTFKSGMPQGLLLSELAEDNTFMRAIAENYVAQTLATLHIPLYYWKSEATAEIDFLLLENDSVVPIEVKKGEYVRSRSLNQYRIKNKPQHCYRFSQKNFGVSDDIIAIPLYAVFGLEL